MKLRMLFVSLVCLSGCSVGGDDPRDAGPGSDSAVPPTGNLRIEPADHVASITGGPVQLDYRAFLREGGGEREVTATTTWETLVPELGSFTGSTFTSAVDRGGRTTIRAYAEGESATTSLTLNIERTIITPGTPSDAPTRFGGTPDAANAPEIVYPNDGTMVPPNLSELEIHYLPNGRNLFELTFEAGGTVLHIYFGCPESVPGGCIYTPDREVWETISTAARGLGPITYRLRGVDDAGNLGATADRTLTVAEEPITGGLYYWNAGGGSIDRFEFGVRGARAERFLTQSQAGAMQCVGCHTLSRDGSRIAFGTDIPTTTFQVFDVATRTRVFSLGGGFGANQPNFASFSPDAAQLATSDLDGLQVRDATTGNIVVEGLGGGPASMPDWSPDGQTIVYVSHDFMLPPFPIPGEFLTDVPGVTSGSIEMLRRNGSTWEEMPTLVQRTSENNFYPAFSPDGNWVVFNRSPSNASSMGDASDPMTPTDSELWAILADGSGNAMRLTRANETGDTWPKWDPTEYQDNDRPIFWLAWSSRRAYGLRYGANERVQLWMTAFDPAQAASGDPAMPAFRLPFQNIESGNHIAQWVTSVQRQSCSTDVDCGGEFCVEGRCYEQTPLF